MSRRSARLREPNRSNRHSLPHSPWTPPETCCKIAECYARYWRIENWHRILKSGCKVENGTNRSAERIAHAAAVNLVIGRCILLITLLRREHPDLPPKSWSPNWRSGS